MAPPRRACTHPERDPDRGSLGCPECVREDRHSSRDAGIVRAREVSALRQRLRTQRLDVWWHAYGRDAGRLLGAVEDIEPSGRIVYRAPEGHVDSVHVMEGWVRVLPRQVAEPVAAARPVAAKEGHHNRRRAVSA